MHNLFNYDREIITIDDMINLVKSFNNGVGSAPYGFIVTTECFEIIRCSLSTEYSCNDGVINITFCSYPLLISDIWCEKMNCQCACVNKEIYDLALETQNKIDTAKKNKLQRIDEFKIIFKDFKYIGIKNIDEVIGCLDNIGYFDAPASTKYHGDYIGGLFDHSYVVTSSLLDLTEKLELKWERPISPYIIGMFHDLCKCDDYIYNSTSEKFEHRNDLILNGHGEKSVIMAQKLIDLTDEEIACIRWHMGAYDEKENWDILGRAIERYPNVLYTHTADMIASKIKGI
jgi:hypothetical protein